MIAVSMGVKSHMPKVLVTPTMLQRCPGPYSEILEKAGFEVVYPPPDTDTMQPGVIAELLQGMDAILASVEPLSRDVLAGSQLRVVARMGVGYDSVDIPAATDLGIVVTITPGTLEASVAEQTIVLLLGVTRAVLARDREVRDGVWSRKPLLRLAGKTLGIVGLGRIGKAVVPRALGLGMKIIACDPYPDQAFAAANNVTLCSLDELLSTADVVSLHSPCTPETINLINAETLAKMKCGAVFVNTSRGGLVDEDALCDALRSGHLLGAALDVFKQEPLPTNSPLLELDNLLLCTHMGGIDLESQVAASSLAAQCIADLYQGRWPEACVLNRQLRDGWRWQRG
jgi:phosphoglycerate dehydrogenase-like enzyme